MITAVLEVLDSVVKDGDDDFFDPVVGGMAHDEEEGVLFIDFEGFSSRHRNGTHFPIDVPIPIGVHMHSRLVTQHI